MHMQITDEQRRVTIAALGDNLREFIGLLRSFNNLLFHRVMRDHLHATEVCLNHHVKINHTADKQKVIVVTIPDNLLDEYESVNLTIEFEMSGFQCGMCDNLYATKFHLDQHVKTNHTANVQDQETAALTNPMNNQADDQQDAFADQTVGSGISDPSISSKYQNHPEKKKKRFWWCCCLSG